MARILYQHVEDLLIDMSTSLAQAGTNPLVTFEIQRRINDVPANLMELFFLEPDSTQIERWHSLSPWERFGWVETLLRYRCPGTSLHLTQGRGRGTGTTLHIVLKDQVEIDIRLDLPPAFDNAQNFWKGMDDVCLLVGVCFYCAVLCRAGDGDLRALFDDPSAPYVP